MALRPLGNSPLSIAPLAFGGNVFGWSADETRSFELLDAFVDAGCNLIDTADVYPAWVPGNQGGESEAIIGRWLKRSGKRDKVVIATKVGKWAEQPGLSPVNLQQAVDRSLQRLQTDYIDLYLAHEDDASVLLADTLGGFARLIEQGKVRAIGASNYNAHRFAEALAVSREHNLPRYEVLQPEYNLLERAGYESELEPLMRAENIGVISYYALASGFLSGKYRDEADLAKSSARASAVKRYLNPRGLQVLATLDAVAATHQATAAQVALAWLIARPGITAPIASATTVTQLNDLIGAVKLQLGADEIAELDRVSA
ncbi:putative oxidoreductase, aryl-alcohol dehydrogenase like protein [Rhodanobacter fulvus Jip2]|uniref:Putative oxidoreductase, aryl-alcohol dehydrogenase like protein n=1 Tax=Rhodanobacter fulvus Jip2 TaxID=1163408 RepID=I4VPI3_9GAMM|nr:aldo/keto reductase [Rhodanobacter fulvus]EIL89124.1 putative oxidoreductase, aryl-alcohol dehydrogenase like protein [Rhodanobacter fulvus Jip2]